MKDAPPRTERARSRAGNADGDGSNREAGDRRYVERTDLELPDGRYLLVYSRRKARAKARA
jgi:hypothetical protein